MVSKNEHINLWILDQKREEDRKRALEEMNQKNQVYDGENKNRCSKCKKGFDAPKLVPVCPHCLQRIDESAKTGCQYWFGFLNQKEKTEIIPQQCVECEKVLDCMLSQKNSENAVSEIRKWY